MSQYLNEKIRQAESQANAAWRPPQAVRASVLPPTQQQASQRAGLVQRSYGQQPVQRTAIDPEIRRILANVTALLQRSMALQAGAYNGPAVAKKAMVQKAQAQQQPAVTVRVHPAGPHFSGAWVPEQQYVSLKDQVRASVGLPPAGAQPAGPKSYLVELPAGRPPALRQQQQSAAGLPISPETGQPSKLTAAIRRSVGIK